MSMYSNFDTLNCVCQQVENLKRQNKKWSRRKTYRGVCMNYLSLHIYNQIIISLINQKDYKDGLKINRMEIVH